MRICHFIASRGLGRGEFYVDLINELCKATDITVVIPKNAKYRKRIDSRVRVVEYKAVNTRRNPLLLLELLRIFKKLQPDLVHTHFGKATEIFYFLNKFLNICHIGTKHNARKGRIFNKINNVTAVSETVRQSIRQKHVKLIYNGINPEPVRLRPQSRDNFTICSVGRLEHIKGFDILINEVAKLGFVFRLQIVGEGKERIELQRLIEQNKLTDRVFLPGFREEIPKLMASSHLVVVSSRSEGFSIALLEGIFYSDLAISTNVGIAREILSDDFIIPGFNIAEKINDIYERYDYYTKKFRFIKEKVQNKFLLTNVASQYIGYYQEVLSDLGSEK